MSLCLPLLEHIKIKLPCLSFIAISVLWTQPDTTGKNPKNRTSDVLTLDFQVAIKCKTGFFFFLFNITIRHVYILGVETVHSQLQLISCMAKYLRHSAGWEHYRGLSPLPGFWDQDALPNACSYARINRIPARCPS